MHKTLRGTSHAEERYSMLIWIAAATFIALGFGSFVVLLVAEGISGQAVKSDLDLEEQPIGQ